jgi:hypothetical protein
MRPDSSCGEKILITGAKFREISNGTSSTAETQGPCPGKLGLNTLI